MWVSNGKQKQNPEGKKTARMSWIQGVVWGKGLETKHQKTNKSLIHYVFYFNSFSTMKNSLIQGSFFLLNNKYAIKCSVLLLLLFVRNIFFCFLLLFLFNVWKYIKKNNWKIISAFFQNFFTFYFYFYLFWKKVIGYRFLFSIIYMIWSYVVNV